jgi:hypothetical protein
MEFHFYGDDDCVRHLRVLMHTDSQQIAERCLDLNIQTWAASLEVSVMLGTNRPFQVTQFPGSQMIAAVLGPGTGESCAALLKITSTEKPTVDYRQIAMGMVGWGGDVSHHLFYFRRFVDNDLPLDVRWLNGYRLLEWHFLRGKGKLHKSSEWRGFLARFKHEFEPLARLGQTASGLLEEARFLAAHAGLDDRSEAERQREPLNPMQKTFRVLEQLVITVLNEHPLFRKLGMEFTANKNLSRGTTAASAKVT